MTYNRKIIRISTSIKYFNEILGLPEDLSEAILRFFSDEIGDDKKKSNYYMANIRKNIQNVIENSEKIKENPIFLSELFPFVDQRKEEHKYNKEIQYMTSANRKYAPWVEKLIDSGKIKKEDFVKVKNLLDEHADLVRKGTVTGKESLIDNFEDDSDLYRFLKKYRVDTTSLDDLLGLKEVQAGSNIVKVKETDDYLIVLMEVKTYPAMKALAGKDSAWCVAQDENTFNSYSPSLYYMFFFNGEPEILIHKDSDQMKTNDDSTSYDPFMISNISDIIAEMDLNTGEGDFERYNEVLSIFNDFEKYDSDHAKKLISENPSSIIYVNPNRYSEFMESFVRSMGKMKVEDFSLYPKSFLNYLGQYLKINNLYDHFRFMENIISDYLNYEEYSNYFKKIPDIFHTTEVYENGYLKSIKDYLEDSYSLSYASDILKKLNQKEIEREDIRDAMLKGIRYKPTIESSARYQLPSEISDFRNAHSILDGMYGDEIENVIIENISNIISTFPSMYELVTDEKIKSDQRFFEATKIAIKSHPEYYEKIPEEIRNNFRYSVFRGYLDLAKKVSKGEEPSAKLKNVPEFVKRNPKYRKIIETQERYPSLELKYKLDEAKKQMISKKFMTDIQEIQKT